eukprot:1151094-Pelagomonas_calceolata.AAC.7
MNIAAMPSRNKASRKQMLVQSVEESKKEGSAGGMVEPAINGRSNIQARTSGLLKLKRCTVLACHTKMLCARMLNNQEWPILPAVQEQC